MPHPSEVAKLKRRAKQNGTPVNEALAGVVAPKKRESNGRRQKLGHLSKLLGTTFSAKAVDGMPRRMKVGTFGNTGRRGQIDS